MEKKFYNKIKDWDFSMIKREDEKLTDWDMYELLKKEVDEECHVLDLGTAGGEKVLKYFPDCYVLGTDYSEAMIETANENLKKSSKTKIEFRLMDNLKMDVEDNFYDCVTARHTVTDPKQIIRKLKSGGLLLIRGVDKMDCYELKRIYGKGQGYNDEVPISVIDYLNVLDAGFKDVELIPIHIREYYKTKEDLMALLVKTPILDDFEEKSLDLSKIDEYIKTHTYEKGILLIRRYYGISARKA